MKSKLLKSFDVGKVKFAARSFKLFSHPDRMIIINLLLEHNELYVSQIYAKLDLQPAMISLHLSLLYEHNILNKVRKGKQVIYSINKRIIDVIGKFSEDFYR